MATPKGSIKGRGGGCRARQTVAGGLLLGLSALGGGAAERPVCAQANPACGLVNQWYKEGTAAGNVGDQYDNRDRGHAPIRPAVFPQVGIVTYTPAERQRNADYSGPQQVRPQVTVGNASLSAGVGNGGSVPRLMYLTNPKGIRFLHTLYHHNNLYVFPEHRDHDPGHSGVGGYGDLYPLNTPYLIITAGSSGSDLPFVGAALLTLAAFRPEVKQRLIESRLLLPTLQMIMRYSNRSVQDDARYLSGAAHPSVFHKKDLDVERMVRMAHGMAVDAVPPLVRLQVVEEKRKVNGRDFFAAEGRIETLADTPGAIARIYRDLAPQKTLLVSAENSMDLNGRPLRFDWVVLRGDSEGVDIDVRPGGTQARITLQYPVRRRLEGDSRLQSNRVDIGVFAHNGVYYSAPAFVSFYSLDNEERIYGDDGRLRYIDYAAGEENLHLNPKGYDAWRHVFGLLTPPAPEPSQLQAELLAAALGPRRLENLRRTGARLQETFDQLEAVQGQLEELGERLKNKKRALERVEAIQRPTAADSLAAAALGAETKSLTKEIHQIRQRRIPPLKKVLDGALYQEPLAGEAGGHSPHAVLMDALEQIREDVGLYPAHVGRIHALMRRAAAETAVEDCFWERRDLLLRRGLLHEIDNSRYMLDLPRVKAGLPADEKYIFRRFNVCLMQQVLFRQLLTPQRQPNYVDSRLSSQKPWRDIYIYQEDGTLMGWKRYDDAAKDVKEFIPDGRLVVSKDLAGRPLRARPMGYRRDERGRLSIVPNGPVQNIAPDSVPYRAEQSQ